MLWLLEELQFCFLFFLGKKEGGRVLDLSVPTPVISPNVVILGIPFFFPSPVDQFEILQVVMKDEGAAV